MPIRPTRSTSCAPSWSAASMPDWSACDRAPLRQPFTTRRIKMNLELNVCTPTAPGRAPSPGQTEVDFSAIKQRQHATWASGDYAIVGTTLQIVGEHLAEAVDLRAGEQVLDVAAGNGNATLAAARRFAHV